MLTPGPQSSRGGVGVSVALVTLLIVSFFGGGSGGDWADSQREGPLFKL